MIKNNPTPVGADGQLLRGAIEHRATWFALLIEEAQKQGLDGYAFAHNAIKRCGVFHGDNKYTKTDDLQAFAAEFAAEPTKSVFGMEIKENDGKHLYIDFHYCPLVAAWQKLGLPESEMPELCDIAMDGDRGIISTFPKFSFELGETIAKGDDVCQIRIEKHD